MYGVDSLNDVSPRIMEMRADPWIFKATNLFKDKDFDAKYKVYEDKALELIQLEINQSGKSRQK